MHIQQFKYEVFVEGPLQLLLKEAPSSIKIEVPKGPPTTVGIAGTPTIVDREEGEVRQRERTKERKREGRGRGIRRCRGRGRCRGSG